jgi:uncharacterized Zn finger protein
MSASSLPRLTEKQIRALATEQSFERGDRYYRQGAIFNAVRQDQSLRGDCQGSSLYHVQVTFDRTGVADSRCTCPYDWGGLCKHQVALLLTYARDPDGFQVIPPMTELLANWKQQDLIGLIERIVQQYPETLYLIELARPHPQGQPIDLSTYRRKIHSALKRDEVLEVLRGVEGLEDAARQLQEREDWLNAGALYQLLIQEIALAYDGELQSIDYNGDVACVVHDAIAGLANCLEQIPDLNPKQRQAWLDTLLEAELKDYELGGIEFAYGATEALLDLATDEEWQRLETTIREQIEQQDDWSKEQLVKLLAQRYQQAGKSKAASRLIHELGTPQQRAFLFVDEGQYEKAIAIATTHFSHLPGLLTRFADALVEANQPELALQFITRQKENIPYGYNRWLSNFHRTQGNPQRALELDVQEFTAHPSFPQYLELRKLAQSLGTWENLRQQLLKTLEKANQNMILIDIAIEEGDSDRAFKLFQSDRRVQFVRAEAVAQAIAKTHSQDAIEIYCNLAQKAIDQKSRSSYQTATTYLKQVKALQQPALWQEYIRHLRQTYARLPAFQDELNRAGL